MRKTSGRRRWSIFRQFISTGRRRSDPENDDRTKERGDASTFGLVTWSGEPKRYGRRCCVLRGAACDQRKAHEEHVGFSLREINHRAKNMAHLVQAIGPPDRGSRPEDFVESSLSAPGAVGQSGTACPGTSGKELIGRGG